MRRNHRKIRRELSVPYLQIRVTEPSCIDFDEEVIVSALRYSSLTQLIWFLILVDYVSDNRGAGDVIKPLLSVLRASYQACSEMTMKVLKGAHRIIAAITLVVVIVTSCDGECRTEFGYGWRRYLEVLGSTIRLSEARICGGRGSWRIQ
jgi:hypothetical protein